jgi:hypothetical protein
MRLIPILLSAALTSAIALPAIAETGKHYEAKRLVDEAKAVSDRGDLQGARDILRRAHKLEVFYETSGNLGHIEMRLGAWRDAAEHLSEAVSELRQNPQGTGKLQTAAGWFAQAQSMVVTIRVRVKPAGATVTVPGQDPKAATDTPLELFVDPGITPIVATADGYVTYKDRVIGGPGELKDLEITLEHPKTELSAPSIGPATAAPIEPADHHSDIPANAPDFPNTPASARPWWPYAVGGGVVAGGLIGGVAFTLAANSSESEYKGIALPSGGSACGSGTPHAQDCARLSDAADRVAQQHNFATASFALAGAAGLGTLGYFIWTQIQPNDTSTVRASAGLAPGTAYALVTGSF